MNSAKLYKFLVAGPSTSTSTKSRSVMAEPDAKMTQASGGPSSGPMKAPKPPNPVWRMMGAHFYLLLHPQYAVANRTSRTPQLPLQAPLAKLVHIPHYNRHLVRRRILRPAPKESHPTKMGKGCRTHCTRNSGPEANAKKTYNVYFCATGG